MTSKRNPTPRTLSVCPWGAGSRLAIVDFNQPVVIPPGAVTASLDDGSCKPEADPRGPWVGFDTAFYCTGKVSTQSRLRLRIGQGITMSGMPNLPMELISGADSLERELDGAGARKSADCLLWSLQ